METVDTFAWDATTDKEPASSNTQEMVPAAVQTTEDPTRYGDWVVKGRCIDF